MKKWSFVTPAKTYSQKKMLQDPPLLKRKRLRKKRLPICSEELFQSSLPRRRCLIPFPSKSTNIDSATKKIGRIRIRACSSSPEATPIREEESVRQDQQARDREERLRRRRAESLLLRKRFRDLTPVSSRTVIISSDEEGSCQS